MKHEVRLQSNQWHVLSANVDAGSKKVSTYIDGLPCCVDTEVDDLTLKHQLQVLGGAKQGFLRGGNVRELLMHSRCLSVEEIQAYAKDLHRGLRLHVVWVQLNGNPHSSRAVREMEKWTENVDIQVFTQEDTAMEYIREHVTTIAAVVCTLYAVQPEKEEEEEKEEEQESMMSEDPEMKKRRLEEHMALTPGLSFGETLREAYQGTFILDKSQPPKKPRVLVLEERVEARFRGLNKWYKGKVKGVYRGPSTIVHASLREDVILDAGEHAYDIKYEDGDEEFGVLSVHV